MKRSICKGCGAEMVWAVNPATRKRIPLDIKPPVYIAIELPTGEVEALRCDDGVYGVSHFATCPKANEFSGGKR